MGGNSGLGQNGSSEGGKRSQADYILKVETQESADSAECEYKRKRGGKDDSQIFSLSN